MAATVQCLLSVLARFGGRQKGRMMAQLGADVEQLDSLARRFDQEAQTIENTISTITSQIGATWWQRDRCGQFPQRMADELHGVSSQCHPAAAGCGFALPDAGQPSSARPAVSESR